MPESNSENQLVKMERLRQRVAQLEAEVKNNNDPREEPQRSIRDISLMNSAFGGTDFQPTGFAALSTFKPFRTNQKAKNAAFDRKARESRRDPGVFDGNQDLFDKWIIKIADKCEEDLETFRQNVAAWPWSSH